MMVRDSCKICRERFWTAPNDAATRYCSRCKVEHQSPGNAGDQGGKSLIRTIVAKSRKSRISQSSKYESMNCEPSDLATSCLKPEARPRKRALLVGVIYKGLKYKLKGPIIDVQRMRGLLMNDFDFPKENIRVLTEEEPNPELTPTKKNILNSMEWLVKDCQKGDSLVFYFSGHGLRQIDFDGDESDHFDETICPVDFMEQGLILDNDIYSIIIKPLTEGVRLHAFIDACHSGTMLDLSFVYDRERKKWKESSCPSGLKKPTGGLAISIGACRDDQNAADTSRGIGKPTMTGGAMTYMLTTILKKNQSITYGELLDSMFDLIEDANRGCLPKRIMKRALKEMLTQKPQLSSSEAFEVYKKQFVL